MRACIRLRLSAWFLSLSVVPSLALLSVMALSGAARSAATEVPLSVAGSPSGAVVEKLGFSSERLARMDRAYQDKVARGEMPGIVILIARHGHIVHRSAIGYADIETKKPMQMDNIFRLYSMSKPVAGVALMMLYEEGRFQIDDPISKYLPEFANIRVLRDKAYPITDTVPARSEPTIKELFTHSAGFRHGTEQNSVDEEYRNQQLFSPDTSLAEAIRRLAKIPLYYQPGTETIYSVAPEVEARLVEVLSGMPYDRFLETRLYAPLKMKDTAFWYGPDRAGRLASFYWHDQDDHLVRLDDTHVPSDPTVFIENLDAFHAYTKPHARTGGSVSLASTADDYWHFVQMLLNRGALHGERVLGAQIVDLMTRGFSGDKPAPAIWGIGFMVIKNPGAFGSMASEGSYGWGGLNCNTFWVDPKLDMVIVALSQESRNKYPSGNYLRSLVYSAMTE